MKSKEKFRCPDGRYVTSASKMSKEWKAIYDPICKHFGVKVIGFDPGVLFTTGNRTFDLPVSIAVEITRLIENQLHKPDAFEDWIAVKQ